MSKFADLKSSTDEFFSLHWPRSGDSGDYPTWTMWEMEQFLHGAVPPDPYTKQGGCYALFEGDVLQYVGKGIAKGGGATPFHGLARRIGSHILLKDRTKVGDGNKLKDTWSTITCICTIGFPDDIQYLALALEGFLIQKLLPPRNVI